MKYCLSCLQMDVHCFLLTDIFLVCKQTAKKAHGNLKVSFQFNNLNNYHRQQQFWWQKDSFYAFSDEKNSMVFTFFSLLLNPPPKNFPIQAMSLMTIQSLGDENFSNSKLLILSSVSPACLRIPISLLHVFYHPKAHIQGKKINFFISHCHFTQVIRQPYLTDRLIVKLKENVLQCVYLNEFNMAVGAFILQCNEAKNWYDGINKARHIYIKLKQDSDNQMSRHHSFVNNNNNTSDNLSIRKSPLGSSIGELKFHVVFSSWPHRIMLNYWENWSRYIYFYSPNKNTFYSVEFEQQ